MPPNDLKKLPASERIKRLKELEKEKKKEIEEAQKEIQETEVELTEEQKWIEKVPIPEVAKEDLEGLSAAGKQLLKTHRGAKEKPPAEEETIPISKKKNSLEETVGQERVTLSPEALAMEYGSRASAPVNRDYTLRLSQQPMGQLYQEMAAMTRTAEEKGYVSREDERRIEYLTGAVEEKMKAVESGRYSLSEEAAQAAMVTQQLGVSLRNAYKSGRVEHDWYKGR